jgi:hypothetical protein
MPPFMLAMRCVAPQAPLKGDVGMRGDRGDMIAPPLSSPLIPDYPHIPFYRASPLLWAAAQERVRTHGDLAT